jgi:hypothetical protein
LLFDPGEKWEYGSNLDWAGQVVEGIAGKRLGEVMKERIFKPLGMEDTAFSMNDSMRKRMVTMHQRDETGKLTALPDFTLPTDPEVPMGGHGLYSTVLDYAKFIRMWLNDGQGPGGPVLKKDTVENAVKNGLPGEMKIKGLPGVIPSLSNYAEFFPGMPKSWALTFMINDHDAPTGRPAGSLAWAGLPNLTTGLIARMGSAAYGPLRSSPLPTRLQSAATSISRPRCIAPRRQKRPPDIATAPAVLRPGEPPPSTSSSRGRFRPARDRQESGSRVDRRRGTQRPVPGEYSPSPASRRRAIEDH